MTGWQSPRRARRMYDNGAMPPSERNCFDPRQRPSKDEDACTQEDEASNKPEGDSTIPEDSGGSWGNG